MYCKPLISIITVCFNVADELDITMSSVIKQDYDNIEYIVIDGGSSDHTIEVIETYNAPISKLGGDLNWVSESDSGIYEAMNKGLDRATGDWVIFMNAGDSFASPSVLNDIFTSPRNSDIIFGKSITRYKELTAIRYLEFGADKKDWYLSKMPNHQAIFINKSLYAKHRYDTAYRYSADTVFLRQVFQLAKNIDEVKFAICNFELGGKSNFYGDYKTFKSLVKDSQNYNNKTITPLLKHSVKYFFQVILGKNIYLRLYIRLLDKK